jgi:hypothetical protein
MIAITERPAEKHPGRVEHEVIIRTEAGPKAATAIELTVKLDC